MTHLRVLLVVAGLVVALPAAAQTPAVSAETIAAASATARPSDQPAALEFYNRHIVTLRAEVLGRPPAERAAAAVELFDRLVQAGPVGRVATEPLADAALVTVGGRLVFAILPPDADPLAGETVELLAAGAVTRLQLALDEAVEAHNPSRLLEAGLTALAATVVYVGLVWLLGRAKRSVSDWLSVGAERQLGRLPGSEIVLHASTASNVARRTSSFVWVLLLLFLTDIWLIFVLQRFPLTRPFGESLRSSVLSALGALGQRLVEALPNLVVVLVIIIVTRMAARLVSVLFGAVAAGRIALPGIYPETAAPSRRIVNALLWLCALIMSYGYLPGSDSDAFKGVSVFVGLMVSLGSSGIMNQVMSGFTVTFSRALRLGDYVRVGDIEGTVVHLGTLATKIKTPRREDVTIPNAIVVSTATTNFSRHAHDEGVFTPTSVTIGYDAPWRQVHALLLLAASRTSGLRSEPAPMVRQAGLQDFNVQYTLLACLEHAHDRIAVLDALHANIQDAFNEYGVQIMSPGYEADPAAPKLVPRDRWYAAPARPD